MNERRLHARYIMLLVLIILLLLILSVRLFVLTILEHEAWAEAGSEQSTKEIVTAAPRGEILDRYGRVLATNKQLFTVTFNVSGLTTDEINESAYALVNLLRENGDEDKMVDNFPIVFTKRSDGTRGFAYTYDRQKRAWLKDQGFDTDLTAEEAYNALREKYEIDPNLDRFEALEVLKNANGAEPPILVRSMEYAYDARKEEFLTRYGLPVADSGPQMSAEEAFAALRHAYNLDVPLAGQDEVLSDEEVRQIFTIREEIKNLGFNHYQSSTIAKDVSEETICYIEEAGNLMPGVAIASETVRVYPNGSLASHILGYMGSISDSEYESYVTEKGYGPSDLIGKDGIERSMEDKLRGQDGVETIQVNSSGDYMHTIDKTEPIAGRNVYLTIDMDLQRVAETTLRRTIEAVQTGADFKSRYGKRPTEKYENCASGALVALDVETGDVLAMASYPDYDPNIFAEGISYEDWASVQSTNPRDSLAPTPLYSIATKSSVQPGSTFKPVTAVAALQAGLNPNTVIYDYGRVTIGDRTYGCDSWNRYKSSHGNETLVTGIQNSCNYYFYCIATGKNWQNGASLGYENNISIEKIMQVADEFGLGDPTGVELAETTTPLASAERKMAAMRNSLWYTLYARAGEFFPSSVTEDEEALRKDIDTICSWMEENPDRATIIYRLGEETSVRDNRIEAVADLCKFSFFNLASWSVGDEFNIAIGQGDNAYTPLQMANYAATLGNDGKRNQVNIVKGVEDEGETEKPEPYQIEVSKSELDLVLEGMRRVTQYGTLASVFRDFPVAVAGKTGTAEKDGKIQPPDEVAYVKAHLAEIAPSLTWKQVQKEMRKMMEENPERYVTENGTVDAALIRASKDKVTQAQIDQFKDDYDPFAWTIALAPADNPKIAVVSLLIQGGMSSNAGLMAREMIGAYLHVDRDYDTVQSGTQMTR